MSLCLHVFSHDTVHIRHTYINNISVKLGEIASTTERNIYAHTHLYIYIHVYIYIHTCMYIHTYIIGFKKIGISDTMEG